MNILISYYNNDSYKGLLEEFYKSAQHIDYNIYNKSNETIPNTYKLKNQGREADTYLYHIINNYDNLKDYTFFFQDDVDNHITDTKSFTDECFRTIQNDIKFKIFRVRWRKDYRPISRVIENGYLNLHTLPSTSSIKDFCNYMNIDLPQKYTTETCAFMVIHKNLILNKPKDFYIKIREWLLMNDKNAFVLEHCWKLIFSQ